MLEHVTQDLEVEEDPKRPSGIRYVILELSAVSSIDTSGVSILMDLRKALDKKNLDLVLVNPIGEVMEKLNKEDGASLSSAMKYQTTTSIHV